ncbi:MAG: Lrp/AsnC family transcriptional regulator [Gemmatimonadetes bacterium]|jgi:DNA-binding Lrp family transcriptional regulator|nr:Lrp/AsnC family transcriptional regulator [Gemmatimonadota bacterium]MCZ6824856.1 Lrp/AsnC family transcriptional regulator [Gemmatimonadota bacterium]
MTYRDLDIRLIRALQEDGRRSLRQLANVLGVSTSTVSKRLEDLRERGVVKGFRPVIDYARLGYGLIAVTKIKARGDALPSIVEALAAERNLTHVYEITGEFDVLVIGRFRNEREMNREIKRMLSLPGIEGTNTSVVLSAAKEDGDVELLCDGVVEPPGDEAEAEPSL